MATRFIIQDGPSKHDLSVSHYFGNNARQVPITFMLGDNPEFKMHAEVCISGSDREDGSGESWLIRGVVRGGPLNFSWRKFEGYYDVRSRKGHMNVEV